MQRRGEEKKTHFLIAKLSRRPMPTPPLIEAAIPNIIIIIINSLNHHSWWPHSELDLLVANSTQVFCCFFFFFGERERERCLLFNCVFYWDKLSKTFHATGKVLTELVRNCDLGYIRPSPISCLVMVAWSWVVHNGGFAIRVGTMVARVVSTWCEVVGYGSWSQQHDVMF